MKHIAKVKAVPCELNFVSHFGATFQLKIFSDFPKLIYYGAPILFLYKYLCISGNGTQHRCESSVMYT